MPRGIDSTTFDQKRQSACDNFYKDVEIAQDFLWYYAEAHGIDKERFERAWEHFCEELEQIIHDEFSLDLDSDEMGGKEHVRFSLLQAEKKEEGPEP